MKKYSFKFNGRQSGAIGITYKIRDTYMANNIGEAMYKLITDYEHITGLQATENGKQISTDNVTLIECDVPKRTRDPKTGSYKYTRSDTPES